MPSRLLCPIASGGGGAPLFLVPSVGTTPLSLVRLARALAPARPVEAFAFAGMDDDGPPHASIPAMARDCVEEILERRARGPYLVGGHCFGGLIALEIALELEARGATATRLVVIDAAAPPIANEVYGDGRPETIAAAKQAVRRLHEEVARRTIASAATLGAETATRVGALVRIHAESSFAYRARPFHGSLHVFATAGCPAILLDYWSRIAAGAIARHALPGDTFSILKPPLVDGVGRAVGAVLAESA